MFVQNRSRRAFLEGLVADLASAGRFWCHFRFSGFPKRRPLDHNFRPKGRKDGNPESPEKPQNVPERSLQRKTTRRGPRTPRYQIVIDFGPISDGSWYDNLDVCLIFRAPILHRFGIDFFSKFGPSEPQKVSAHFSSISAILFALKV